jgi:hypothetical protein
MIHPTYHLRPDSNRVFHPSKRSALILLYHKKPFPKPLQLACAYNFQKIKYTLKRFLKPLIGGQKVKELAEFFMVDVGILYVLVIKNSDFFNFFGIYVPFQK